MASCPSANLFSPIPEEAKEEFFETLLARPGFVVKRIVSQGHATPAGQWLQEQRGEWVVVLHGNAEVRFEGKKEPFYAFAA